MKQNTKPRNSTNHKIFNGPKGNPSVLQIKILFLSHGTGKHVHEQRSKVVCLQFKEHPRSKVKEQIK